MIKLMMTPRQVFIRLTGMVCILTILHAAGQIILIRNHSQLESEWLIRLFYFDAEQSFPTLFSFMLLQSAAFLLALITVQKWRVGETYLPYWGFLCAIFLFLSFDEILMIHENLITPRMSWAVPYLLVTAMIGLNFLRFLAHLPAQTRRLFILSGLVYVGGAAGLEIPGGQYYHTHGADRYYVIFITFEEIFEMMGIVLFIYALFEYSAKYLPQITFGSYRITAVSK